MADDNSELLAMMGEVLRAVDRQTEENKKAIAEVGQRFDATVNALREDFVTTFNNFAAATVDGFIRVEGKIDAVKQEVVELRTDVDGLKQEVKGVKQEITELKQEVTEVKQTVQRIDQRLEKTEAHQSVTEDVVRRLTILENIVLNKAS